MLRLVLAVLLALPLVPDAGAQYADLITNVYGRKTVSLNGKWQTIVDPYENGYYDYRRQPYAEGHRNHYASNYRPKDRSELVEYNFDRSPLLSVPGDWNSQRDDLFLYEGTVWYKKDFDYAIEPGRRLFIYFGGANYDAHVYLNGRHLGRHVGGFTPFQFEITDLVQPQGNFLVVKVDNKRLRDAVPTVNTDWWNFGGITRDVLLVDVPQTFVKDYFLQLQKGSSNTIAGWVRVDGPGRQGPVRVRIPETRAITTVTPDTSGYASVSFRANLGLWSPESPKRYDVIVEAGDDQVTERIGFRTLETRGTDILLNGKSIFLRGISVHEQAPLRPARAYSPEDARTLLTWAQQLGCNMVRLAHYPHNEHMTRMADSMGVLVWSEIPVYWTIQWENPETLENARNQLTENITRDKNRASVVLWSVANETPLSAPRLAFLTALTDLARKLDSTRLITAALEHHYVDDTTLMIDDPLGAHLDVLGNNEYIGWYDGLPAKADAITFRTVYDKPLIMSEFGGDALQGHFGDPEERWTEDYQRSLYEHQVEMLSRIPFLRGTTPWILTDFLSPRRPLPGIQDFWNRKGLISDRGQRKQAFYVLQQWYETLRGRYE